jgi:hypothetical protein
MQEDHIEEIQEDELQNAMRYSLRMLMIRADAYVKWIDNVTDTKNWTVHGADHEIAAYPDGSIGRHFMGETAHTYTDQVLVKMPDGIAVMHLRRFTFEENTDKILSVELVTN